MAEASDFKFGTQLGFAKAHHKINSRKKWGWPWARRAPQNFGFPYNISATAGASDFKFGAQLGFAKAHHKITRRRKDGRGPGLSKLPKILWFHFYTVAEVSDFKFGTLLGFAKAHDKITPIGKSGPGLGLGALQNCVVPLHYLHNG